MYSGSMDLLEAEMSPTHRSTLLQPFYGARRTVLDVGSEPTVHEPRCDDDQAVIGTGLGPELAVGGDALAPNTG